MSDERVLRRYLLGQLAENERESVEERLFTSEPFWEQLGLVEDDLIDAFVRGELAGDERASFESHFLTSPRRRERVAMARALLAPGADIPAARRFSPAAVAALFRRRFSWNMATVGAALSLAAVAVLMIPVAARLAQERDEIAALRRRVEQLATRAPDSPPAAESTSAAVTAELRDLQRELKSLAARAAQAPALSIVLAPGSQRTAGQAQQRIVIPRGAQSVDLILPLDTSARYASFRAVIQTPDGAEVWGADQLSATAGAAGKSLRLSIPSVALKPGSYRIQVWGLGAGRPPDVLDEYFVFQAAFE